MYRKPNGEYTEDAEEMTTAWEKLAKPIERATGWTMYAFDPDLAFHSPDQWRTAHIPVRFACALVRALSVTKEDEKC